MKRGKGREPAALHRHRKEPADRCNPARLGVPEINDKSLGGVLDFLSSSALDADGNEDFGAGICKQMIFGEHLGDLHPVIESIGNQQLARADRERSSVFPPPCAQCRPSKILSFAKHIGKRLRPL